MSGFYTLTCTDPDDVQWTTADIQYNTNEIWVQNVITNYIPFLADKVTV